MPPTSPIASTLNYFKKLRELMISSAIKPKAPISVIIKKKIHFLVHERYSQLQVSSFKMATDHFDP